VSESLIISKTSKQSTFETLLPQIESLILGEPNLVANSANVTAAIKMTFNHLWVGFYFVEGDQLVLGPFQGPLACTRILIGKGVCGTSWKKEKTLLVTNVNQFPGHIACSSESISEIVIPIFNKFNEVIGVLDIDSNKEGEFDFVDQLYYEKIAGLITQSIT
jgi:GAF domain-containing protein